MNKTALSLHHSDDVAVVLAELAPGENCTVRGPGAERSLVAVDTIAFGHKMALRDIAKGAAVHKYGERIGTARCDIAAGAHVHVHNIA